jgi:hypothetical protein
MLPQIVKLVLVATSLPRTITYPIYKLMSLLLANEALTKANSLRSVIFS